MKGLRLVFLTLFLVQTLADKAFYRKIQLSKCNRGLDCGRYGDCMDCTFPKNCIFGTNVRINCTTVPQCLRYSMSRVARCRFCWQLEPSEYSCTHTSNCSTTSAELVPVLCSAHQDVLCMGNRHFYKKTRCNWTSGHSWAKALFLSITLGGFGVDRFYLGLWKSGIGKLFSFGGLGIWTIIDIILIAVGYIRPSDGSHYVSTYRTPQFPGLIAVGTSVCAVATLACLLAVCLIVQDISSFHARIHNELDSFKTHSDEAWNEMQSVTRASAFAQTMARFTRQAYDAGGASGGAGGSDRS
ncbi:unnamed protein product, partial [Mesorhabditis spiculigera]